ncbi:LuxR C-terminal-related transcriptional regulator [Pseudohoeflea sp. DP4N28-3]|uniref:LuxR C-terminal-related transcriptional regulator n=2 Tax=Pseudohoeflea coraliihabitans TaxID=2860393 RepID=A0ABS6WN55_9HYPH|nr:LuxR C-terminal-related transcriptional regulator [Pseudohoeflea sp. DP4N28-3]MBW3097386.1 LuxR C-terminal-related transcriptional regulator [Pseudohoeflea sp. DP4N28-3]
MSAGMDLVCEYASASHYLVARYDHQTDRQMDSILCSNWPFDLVRTLGISLINAYVRNNEFQRCIAAYEPTFTEAGPEFAVPPGLSRRVCQLPFNAGEARLILLVLFADGLFLSNDRLRDVAVAVSYHAANFPSATGRSNQAAELTEREIECLSWIGEGKTSDEIALIIGISRNTVNNYITSIMNKTGARTRSEAVAFGVRHQII